MNCSFDETIEHPDGRLTRTTCISEADILLMDDSCYGLCFYHAYMKTKAENEKLKDFARHVIKQECWGYLDGLDGGDLQDMAEKLGFIENHVVAEEEVIPKDETILSRFKDFGIGDTYYRFTDILKEDKDV